MQYRSPRFFLKLAKLIFIAIPALAILSLGKFFLKDSDSEHRDFGMIRKARADAPPPPPGDPWGGDYTCGINSGSSGSACGASASDGACGGNGTSGECGGGAGDGVGGY